MLHRIANGIFLQLVITIVTLLPRHDLCLAAAAAAARIKPLLSLYRQ
jgi:hypothetical protein